MDCHSISQIERELMEFVRREKATVLPADDPSRLTVGFTAFYMEGDFERSIVVEIRVCELNQEIGELRKLDPGRAETWVKNRPKIAASYTAREKPTFRCGVCGSVSWMPDFDPASHSVDECSERLAESVMRS